MGHTINDFVALQKGERVVYPQYFFQMKEFFKRAKGLIEFDAPQNAESTPEEIAQLASESIAYADQAMMFFSSLKNFKPSYGFQHSSEAIKDLEFIKDSPETKKFSLDAYDKCIQFTTRLKMKDVFRDIEFDFGNFRISMFMDRVTVIPAGENTKRNEQYHPYVKSGSLCLGDFLKHYKIAMSFMRYHAAYTAVMKCLTQYGGDKEIGTAAGPHNPIQLWVGQICSVCDDAISPENISLCEITKRPICQKCIDLGTCTDETTKEIYHPDLLKKCTKEGCGKNTHTVIRGVCLECRKKALVE